MVVDGKPQQSQQMVVYTERQYGGQIRSKKFCLGDWVLSETDVTPQNLSWELAQLKDHPHSTIFVYVTVCNETVEDQQDDGIKGTIGFRMFKDLME